MLEKASREQEISHFYLDVLEQEPLPKENPLWQAENVTITPHVSGPEHSDLYIERCFNVWMKDLERYVNKQLPLHIVDLAKGY